jgi:hypothetical protein
LIEVDYWWLYDHCQLQIGKDMRVELQIPPSPNDDLTTPRRGDFKIF